MFRLNEKYEVGRRNLSYDYILYSPVERSTINTRNIQLYVNIRREDSCNS